jgi:hypothetical protein
MGFRQSASIKVVPGVRVRVSSTGVSTYVGRTRVAGSRTATGSRAAASRRPAPAPPAAQPQPGLFSPREDKILFAAVFEGKISGIDDALLSNPKYSRLAHAIVGLDCLNRGSLRQAANHLEAAWTLRGDLDNHPFARKYLERYSVCLDIYGGIGIELPFALDSVGMAYAESLQSAGDTTRAIWVVEDVSPSYPSILSLADLYTETGQWLEVLTLTSGLVVENDLTALISIIKAHAHMQLGEYVAARETLRSATTGKKLAPAIRHRALMARADVSLTEGSMAKARTDLENILAEDSAFQDARAALADLQQRQQEIEEEKAAAAAAKVRAAEEKARAAAQAREEKKATAERIRAEKAAERARLQAERNRPAPVVQAGIINLASDDGTHVVEESDQPDTIAIGSAARPAGFYEDPEGVAPFRYWDGSSWTPRIRMKL